MTKINIFLLLLVIAFGPVKAQSQEELLQKGNKAYSAKKYDQAIDFYSKIINNNLESADLYYNLGNAYFRTADYASAILYYEKALKLSPGDEDIKFNLAVANTKLVDKIEQLPELFYQRWWNNIITLTSITGWSVLGIIFFSLSLCILGLYLFSKRIDIRRFAFFGALSLFIISAFFLIFAISQNSRINGQNQGIVFSYTLNVKASPDDNSTSIFVIHEGLKVNITDEIGNWYEIKIPNGSKGWIPKESVKEI